MTNNRELKFRAWNTLTKNMFQVELLGLSDKALSPSHLLAWVSIPFQPHIILMQFTGLKDKNGKEIYEEDIIKQNRQNCKVEWNESQAMFGFYEKTSMGKTWRSNCYDSLTDSEVVGNVHETPELLEGLNDKQ